MQSGQSAITAGRGDSPDRRALARLIGEELVHPVFQPIVDLQQAQVAGFETLTRTKPGSGFDNPASLFDAAADSGMLWELEELTRRASLKAASGWHAGSLLFMNCSPAVFADPRFAEQVRTMVNQTVGLSPGRVVLEITERTDQEYVDGLSRQVAILKETGFQIAIDDVGAGTSGLNRIMRLRPHWLKLDRDLVESIDHDRVKQNLIRFLVHFARLSGVKIIAEGVERAEELAVLMDIGITYAQGYYLGRPGPREQMLNDQVVDWLHDRWVHAQSHRVSQPMGQRIGRLVRPAKVMDANSPAAIIAADLLETGDPGLVITENSRLIGWVDRLWALERIQGEHAGYPIGSLMPTGCIAISPEDTLTDVLDQMSARTGPAASHPLIVMDGGRVMGIVPMGEVLSFAAELSRNPMSRGASITGLPGRIRADEHITNLITGASMSTPMQRHDAAFIDIRHFSDYNGAYGYELGDRLLQELISIIRTTILSEDPSAFVSHLGDDRFLITARTGSLNERLKPLAIEFETAAVSLSAASLASDASSTWTEPGVGLRVVLVPDAMSVVHDARELFRVAQRLRDTATPDCRWVTTVGRHSLIARDGATAAVLKVSA